MSAMTDKAPAIAATDKAISPMNPKWLNATPPMLPEKRTTKATPKLAPELIPKTEGPANGFRNTVCICNPLTASPAPATKAVNAWGKRDFQMIFCQVTASFPWPVKIFQTDFRGIFTEPSTIFKNNSMEMSRISKRMRVIFLPECAIFITLLAGYKIQVGIPAINRDGKPL